MQPIYEFGGLGQVMNLALANGFPPATYQPLLQPFTRSYRVTCLLPRALWGDGQQPPEVLSDWGEELVHDLLQGLHDHHLQDVIAVGHSFGGIASMLAAIKEPERFRALILLDPTIVSGELMEMIKTLRATNTLDQMPLVARTLRRQRDFASTEEAFEYFRGRALFKDWSDEVVRLYAEQGTRPTESGVALLWSPEWEAYYFKTGYTGTWDDLPKLRGLLPILIIRGEESDTFLLESAQRVQQILPEAAYVEIPGHGHLFPQSNPHETHRVIQEWLEHL